VRHGLRTLIKQADPGALALLGYGTADDLSVDGPHLHSDTVTVGGTLTFDMTITNTGAEPVKTAVDYVVHYRKANGALAPRVYKLSTHILAPGQKLALTRGQKFVALTTRRFHPGGQAWSCRSTAPATGTSPSSCARHNRYLRNGFPVSARRTAPRTPASRRPPSTPGSAPPSPRTRP
jgi:hypothetical protein